ncbi:pyridoxal 5'-phosphate synthase glutaminase subunit PdxT [Coriobacteriia bacterium Es71-Z0120]|uniref:pyridoxal 5'-phosphate synthase glutaminase subunit PdxT n=1 Tax=Parvivirga hydrogeniphila TaxID=2939460 RepID=UPI002260C992|nr:pyridoxal 5'-phosphate synthase glutaminase subunit PdxT [Parvivirga hydrogeniphila]MCL4079217.1 pyridoxal 5'-phosphate synthase glutaminase subunit PdxT [Parvivirga hydrogeniphila]
MRVGVLALQGAFREHIMMLEALGVDAVAVRKPEQLGGASALIIPGGESTAISKLMAAYGFYDAIRQQHGAGMAVWGTCAGAILIATTIIDALPGQEPLRLMDIAVRRNAYGRQVDSFEADLDFKHLPDGPFRGVFIRAPWIEQVGDGVEVLATHDGHVVAARGEGVMATSFHPELTGDPRVHRFFLDEVVGS